jgi:uracil-DNA glycosylase
MINLREHVGDWNRVLYEVFEDKQVIDNLNYINSLYKDENLTIYPEQRNVFKAFKECPYSKLSVVIILQDPYSDGSATGIAAANEKTKLSPSLQIIYNTILRDVYKNRTFNFDPTLIKWAKQGVLMLNTSLTVEKDKPLSHVSYWARFTKLVLCKLSNINSGITYCLWGKNAQLFKPYINPFSNNVLECYHPVYSVYRGIPWECDHFNVINEYLKSFNNLTINW